MIIDLAKFESTDESKVTLTFTHKSETGKKLVISCLGKLNQKNNGFNGQLIAEFDTNVAYLHLIEVFPQDKKIGTILIYLFAYLAARHFFKLKITKLIILLPNQEAFTAYARAGFWYNEQGLQQLSLKYFDKRKLKSEKLETPLKNNELDRMLGKMPEYLNYYGDLLTEKLRNVLLRLKNSPDSIYLPLGISAMEIADTLLKFKDEKIDKDSLKVLLRNLSPPSPIIDSFRLAENEKDFFQLIKWVKDDLSFMPVEMSSVSELEGEPEDVLIKTENEWKKQWKMVWMQSI